MPILPSEHAEILGELHRNASIHAEASNGFFVIDAFNPRKLPPYISLHTMGNTDNRRFVSSHRAHGELLRGTANAVDRRFASLPNPDINDSRTGIALDNMSEQVKDGEHIGLSLGHGETRDIAFNLGYVSLGLETRGAPHRTALMLSKGIDFLRIDTKGFGFPAKVIDEFVTSLGLPMNEDRTVAVRDFVGVVADYTYFVIPSSQSFKELKEEHPAAVKRFNASTLKLLEKDLHETTSGRAYPIVFGSAITGTLSKPLDIDLYRQGNTIDGVYETFPEITCDDDLEKVRVTGEISVGAVRAIDDMIAYASAIVLDQTQSKIDINPRFKRVDASPEKMDEERKELGGMLLSSLQILYPDLIFVQDLRGNLPLKRAS